MRLPAKHIHPRQWNTMKNWWRKRMNQQNYQKTNYFLDWKYDFLDCKIKFWMWKLNLMISDLFVITDAKMIASGEPFAFTLIHCSLELSFTISQ